MEHLSIDGLGHEVTLVGHDWGWMVGAGVARLRPGLFSKLVILNTFLTARRSWADTDTWTRSPGS